jgi:hypothetical protein
MAPIFIALIAAVASQVLGWLWHGPLFGKYWTKAIGALQPDGTAKMVKGFGWMLLINFIANILLACGFYIFIGLLGGPVFGRTFLFVLFLLVPFMAISLLWNGRPPRDQVTMAGISLGYHVVNLLFWTLLLLGLS